MPSNDLRALVVGGGHNGLVAACYLARAGLDVVVLEASDRPGGGARTEERIPGFAFDTHSVAHNIVNMTAIPRELRLAEAGLRYVEMDPFSVAVFADGRRVRFFRSVQETMRSIALLDRREAVRYGAFVRDAMPLVELAVAGLAGPGRARARRLAAALPRAAGLLRRRGARDLAADLLAPYGALLERSFASDLVRGPVAAFAAHAGAGPAVAGGAFFAFWQAAYHRYGQWHALGGAAGLTRALVGRLEAWGGRVRCDAAVARLGHDGEVSLRGGEELAADVVVCAVDPRVALLELLDPPLAGEDGDRLRAAHAGNAVQALVHVAADALPPYTGAEPGDWHGLQSYVDELDGLRASFAAAEAGSMPPVPAAAYAFTTSALDPGLAPPGAHPVYLACPAAPARVDGGWERQGARLADDVLAQVEVRAPGFASTVRALRPFTPAEMEAELAWPGAHPMHLDVTLDQLGPLRPTPALAGHRTPVPGLYLAGAGTAPVGGIAGAPGRDAAHAALADLEKRR